MKTPSKTRLQVHTALREDGGVSAASTSYPRDATIHGLFEEQAGRTPEAVALLDRDRHWSYAELNRRANLIARRLEEMGVFIGEPVALCFDRSPAMIAAMLGILKAGGAYVPLDPGYPSERLSWMLEDIEASVVLTEPGSRDSLPATNARILTLDDGWAEPSRIFSENPSLAVGPDDLGY